MEPERLAWTLEQTPKGEPFFLLAVPDGPTGTVWRYKNTSRWAFQIRTYDTKTQVVNRIINENISLMCTSAEGAGLCVEMILMYSCHLRMWADRSVFTYQPPVETDLPTMPEQIAVQKRPSPWQLLEFDEEGA